MLLAEGALGVGVALEVPVIPWIGVDQRPNRAVLVRNLRLDSAPGPAVARDHDLPAHIDPPACQLLVVGRDPVVHVDQFAGHVAVGRIGVVRQQTVLLDPRRAVLGQGRLPQAGRVPRRRHHLQLPDPGRREENVVLLQLRFEPPRAEALHHPVRRLLVVRRTHVDRLGDDVLHPLTQVVFAQLRVETSLDLALGARALGREAGDRTALAGGLGSGGTTGVGTGVGARVPQVTRVTRIGPQLHRQVRPVPPVAPAPIVEVDVQPQHAGRHVVHAGTHPDHAVGDVGLPLPRPVARQDFGDLGARSEAGVVRRIHELFPIELGGSGDVSGPSPVAESPVLAGVLVVGARVEQHKRLVAQARVDPVGRNPKVDRVDRHDVTGRHCRRRSALHRAPGVLPRLQSPIEHERAVPEAQQVEGDPRPRRGRHARAVDHHRRFAVDSGRLQRSRDLVHAPELGDPPLVALPGDVVEAKRTRTRDVLLVEASRPAFGLYNDHVLITDVGLEPFDLDQRLDRHGLQRGLLGRARRRAEQHCEHRASDGAMDAMDGKRLFHGQMTGKRRNWDGLRTGMSL